MARYVNTFNTATPIGGAIANLAKAFLTGGPNPQEMALNQAKTDYYRSGASEKQADAALDADQLSAQRGLGGVIGNMMNGERAVTGSGVHPRDAHRTNPETGERLVEAPLPQQSREGHIRDRMPQLAGTMGRMGELSDLGNVFRAVMANAAGTSDQATARAMVGSGKAIGQDDYMSLGDREYGRDRNAALDPKSLSEVKGGLLEAMMGANQVDERDRATLVGTHNAPSISYYQGPAGNTLGVDKNWPEGVAQPVPQATPGPNGGTQLAPTQLQPMGDDGQTSAMQNDAEAARQLGITVQELQFLEQVRADKRASGGLSNMPQQIQDAYTEIMSKVQRNMRALPTTGGQ